LRTAKRTVGLRSTRGEKGERTNEKSDPDPSTIRKDGTDEGSPGVVIRGHRSRLAGVAGEEGGQGGFGDPLTVGLILVQQPRGEDEKEARCGDHHWLEVLDIDVEVQGRPAGLPSRTKPRGQDEEGANAGTIAEPSKTNHGEITLDLSAAGRSGGRGETRR